MHDNTEDVAFWSCCVCFYCCSIVDSLDKLPQALVAIAAKHKLWDPAARRRWSL